jgi:hypothetical protein
MERSYSFMCLSDHTAHLRVTRRISRKTTVWTYTKDGTNMKHKPILITYLKGTGPVGQETGLSPKMDLIKSGIFTTFWGFHLLGHEV